MALSVTAAFLVSGLVAGLATVCISQTGLRDGEHLTPVWEGSYMCSGKGQQL